MSVSAIVKQNAIVPAFNPSVTHRTGASPTQKTEKNDENPSSSELSKKTEPQTPSKTDTQPLTQQEKHQVDQLRKRDQEVKAHEMAHVAAGGQYVSGQINYAYQTGPDGRRYAVGGDVSIDMSEVPGDPQATVNKMQSVRRAALAPASPSQTDRMVAGKATQIEAKARMEALLEKVREKNERDASQPKTDAKSGASQYENQNNDIEEKGVSIDIAA